MADELEARQRALEALMVDRLALDPPDRRAQLLGMVKTWPEGEERAQALQWLEEAERRFQDFSTVILRKD